MALPRQIEKALAINLSRETLVVRSEYFAAKTDGQDVVVVRRSTTLIGVYFEIHNTATEAGANNKTILARADDRLYHQLLNRALLDGEVSLPYFSLDFPPCEPAP